MTTPSSALENPQAAAGQPAAWPWQGDLGNGRYHNPIIYADYSDPDVIRHGDDFYMIASSFNCTPGLPILHSRDLVNWRLINHAVKNLPHPRYVNVQPGCGIWAPAIRHHAGKFWIFFPMPDEGIYVTTTTDPAGQWSEPHLLQAGKGLIDPCPLWDEDGKAYLVHAYAGSRAGIKHRLRVCPMTPDGSALLGEGQVVFHDEARHPTIEGPKFLKQDGWYYILAPAGGVATGWQVALRSRSIYGPYEDRIVLAQGRTAINGPHQGALVDTPRGEWWFIHFQDVGVYGRVVHMQPAGWKDGWPWMGKIGDGSAGEPVADHPKPMLPVAHPVGPPTSDEFTGSKLDLQWQWNANHSDDWCSLTVRPGWLRFFAQCNASVEFGQTPHLLLQKFPARSFAVETKLDMARAKMGNEAGLIIHGQEYASIAAERTRTGCRLLLRRRGRVMELQTTSQTTFRFQAAVLDGGVCQFAVAGDEGAYSLLPETFQATPGLWIGAKVGLYSMHAKDSPAGSADFDYFRFTSAGNL